MPNSQTAKQPVDLSIMTEIAGENREMITLLIKHLLKEYPVKIAEMRQSIVGNDPEKLREAAHKLKGTVSNFGARQAHEMAFALEKMGKENLLDQATETLAKLELEFYRIEKYLKVNYL
ncbi:MAG: Hpt domain-containing protein [Proteobacteria bacterium]|nr:Hpt domain-containing protein [Pseudomonadota bacterium]MBU1717071.1 Hpt domain-containing protein [Pseudomonadota bacterium]